MTQSSKANYLSKSLLLSAQPYYVCAMVSARNSTSAWGDSAVMLVI